MPLPNRCLPKIQSSLLCKEEKRLVSRMRMGFSKVIRSVVFCLAENSHTELVFSLQKSNINCEDLDQLFKYASFLSPQSYLAELKRNCYTYVFVSVFHIFPLIKILLRSRHIYYIHNNTNK